MRSERHLARSVRSPRAVNIADLRRLARPRLPRLVFDIVRTLRLLGCRLVGALDRSYLESDPGLAFYTRAR